MSYMEEWQKQQKALKDEDRQQKKGAATNLNNYRSKQQGLWQKRQKELKEADRKNRETALASLKKYKGGEHDIKEYQRMVAQYKKQLLEQSKSLHAKLAELEPDVPTEMTEESWREHVENHIAEFEKMIQDHGFEDFKELDLSSPRHSIGSRASGIVSPDARSSDFGFLDSTPYQEFIEEGKTENPSEQKSLVEGFPSVQAADTSDEMESAKAEAASDTPMADVETGPATFEETKDENEDEHKPPATPTRNQPSNDAGKGCQTPDAEARATKTDQSGPENSSKSAVPQLQSPPRSVSRMIDLDFSFGIISPNVSPAPTIDTCSSVAASIVPVSLEKTIQQTLPTAVWDSTLQPVLKSVKLDRHYHQPGSIRYLVRGSVPVQMAISDMPSPMRRQLLEEDDLLIESQEHQRWRRVRNGNSPDWASILNHKMGHIW